MYVDGGGYWRPRKVIGYWFKIKSHDEPWKFSKERPPSTVSLVPVYS